MAVVGAHATAAMRLIAAGGLALAGLLGWLWLHYAPPQAAAPGALLFQDDFRNPDSGWLTQQGTPGGVRYSEGGLQFEAALPGVELRSNLPPGYHFPPDVQVDVDVRLESGPADNWFGLACRYQDEANFYWAVISSDGYYGLGRVLAGERRLLHAEQMPPSEWILQGAAQNHLRLECSGAELRFYVNEQLLAQAQDDSLRRGGVGLLAGLEPGADVVAGGPLRVRFQQFIVFGGGTAVQP